MKRFRGRIIAPGKVTASALTSKNSMDISAAFRKSSVSGDKKVTCGDKNNPELYGKTMAGKALCLPRFSSSQEGGVDLYCACAMEKYPACILLSEPVDAVVASGIIMASVWLDGVQMPVIDSLGEAFLNYVDNGMTITLEEDGIVRVE